MASEQSLKAIGSDKAYAEVSSEKYPNDSASSPKIGRLAAAMKHGLESGYVGHPAMLGKSLKSTNSQVPATGSNASAMNPAVGGCHNNNNNNNHNNNNSNNANNSPKMGSRRIFTPQFKLQVLESYRSDSDCKGNQRATARKYNIHRRQIQKWLQCESNLRSSVANINQNNVKHQFHNISHHHQHQHQHHQQLHMSIAAAAAAANSSHSHSHSHYSHRHNPHHQHQPQHHHHHHQLSLDTARHNVASNSLTVPSPMGEPSPATSAHGVLAAANLAAVVAAAAAAGAAGALAIASTPSANTPTTVSPLRPTAIGGSGGASVSPALLHPHHHHHYAMPYTHTPTPANVPVPVPVSAPILTHPVPPQHLHHYQYQNLSHHHSHALTQTQPQTQAQSSASAFLPSASLPVTVLSAAASVATKAANAPPAAGRGGGPRAEEIQNNDELRELSSAEATAAAAAANATGNSYVHNDRCGYVYKRCENGGDRKDEYEFKSYQKYQPMFVTPMDLSLGPRRQIKDPVEPDPVDPSEGDAPLVSPGQQPVQGAADDVVVDLTFRKRKVVKSSVSEATQPDAKLAKLADSSVAMDIEADVKIEVDGEGEAIATGSKLSEKENEKEADEEEEEEVDIDVEEKTPPSKPVKLFKPYLLDEEEERDFKKSSPSTSCENGTEQRDPIIWSHHPACMSPNSYDSRQDSSRGSTFQSPPLEKGTFPAGSTYFHAAKDAGPHSATSSDEGLSPASLRCPKGSPVSGYESSSSTYSESSCRGETGADKAFKIDLKLHPIYHDNLILNGSHVQRWLDQETNVAAPGSIALYA